MAILSFDKKEKRDSPLTVRLTKTTVARLKMLTEWHDVSQADIIERLIEAAAKEHEHSSQNKLKKRRGKE